jgi:hypothetical protein
VRTRTSFAAMLGLAAAVGDSCGWGEFGGGINWRHSGRKNLAKRRAHRKVRNRIASQSRRKNRV